MGLAGEDLPLFFIDIGRDDQEWKTAEEFTALLDENGIPHEWYLFTGGHTEEYWSAHLETYLRWYSAGWEEAQGNEVNKLSPQFYTEREKIMYQQLTIVGYLGKDPKCDSPPAVRLSPASPLQPQTRTPTMPPKG